MTELIVSKVCWPSLLCEFLSCATACRHKLIVFLQQEMGDQFLFATTSLSIVPLSWDFYGDCGCLIWNKSSLQTVIANHYCFTTLSKNILKRYNVSTLLLKSGSAKGKTVGVGENSLFGIKIHSSVGSLCAIRRLPVALRVSILTLWALDWSQTRSRSKDRIRYDNKRWSGSNGTMFRVGGADWNSIITVHWQHKLSCSSIFLHSAGVRRAHVYKPINIKYRESQPRSYKLFTALA